METGVIVRHHVDDGNGEIMYDVAHKFVSGLCVKWVKRSLIRRAPLSPEDIELERLERVWRNQIRRMRLAQERKTKAIREAQIEAEIARRCCDRAAWLLSLFLISLI